MAYRRPGVEVVQQFQALTPALVLPTLPACVVGPAYHIEDDGDAGSYDGTQTDYSYPNQPASSTVDTAALDATELAVIQKPISLTLSGAYVTLHDDTDGTSGTAYTTVVTNVGDSITAPNALEAINATFTIADVGNVLIIANAVTPANDGNYIIDSFVDANNITVVNADGTAAALSNDTAGFDLAYRIPDQTFSSTGAFADVPTVMGTTKYYVELANGTGYEEDDGKHLIKSKTSNDAVELADGLLYYLAGTSEFKVLQYYATIDYENDEFATVGITTSSTVLALPASLSSDPTSLTGDPVSEAASVLVSYRALKTDLADSLDIYTDLDSLEAVFGTGNVIPANPYAYGVNVALNNTTTDVNATGLRATYYTDESGAFQTALEFLEDKDVYGVCVLTQNTAVHQLLDSHVTGQSVSSIGRERIGFINRKLATYSTEVPLAGVGWETSAGSGNGTGALAVNTTFKDPTNGEFLSGSVTTSMFFEINSYTAIEGVDPVRTPAPVVSTGSDSLAVTTNIVTQTTHGTWTAFTAADVGRTIRISLSTAANDGDYTIITYLTATTVVVAESLAAETGGTYAVEILELAPSTTQDSYITSTRHVITSVDSEAQVTLTTDPTNGFYGRLEDVEYRVTDNLTKAEQASFLAGYSTSFANRRLVNVWPDFCYATVSNTATKIPGFYIGCALAGLTAGLPSQQGFTNLSLTGFTAVDNVKPYFTDTHLDTIAGGGTMILLQDVAQAPIYVRHQLTTDTSSIQFQELSITKNVDLVARFFRRLYKPYIGIYNITKSLLDLFKTLTQAGITFLKDQTAPRVGGVLRDGSISSIAEDTLQPDTVNVVLDINVPYPLNNVKVTLLV